VLVERGASAARWGGHRELGRHLRLRRVGSVLCLGLTMLHCTKVSHSRMASRSSPAGTRPGASAHAATRASSGIAVACRSPRLGRGSRGQGRASTARCGQAAARVLGALRPASKPWRQRRSTALAGQVSSLRRQGSRPRSGKHNALRQGCGLTPRSRGDPPRQANLAPRRAVAGSIVLRGARASCLVGRLSSNVRHHEAHR
jgi:hypothetical protein